MFRLNLFRTPGHLRFQYVPQHYDPDKEDLQKRVKAAKNEKAVDTKQAKSRIAQSYRNRYQKHRNISRKANRQSNIRLLVILMLLVGLTYLMFIQFLPAIESAVE
jgi:hypothetical protein